MVSPNLFQASVIARLKATTTLTVVTNDIRESQFQGRDITYPLVRVRIGFQQPREAGECRLTKSVVSFTVSAFSSKDSSEQCAQLIGLIENALFGALLSGTGFRTLRVNARGVLAPYRDTIRTWRSDSHYWVHVYEVP